MSCLRTEVQAEREDMDKNSIDRIDNGFNGFGEPQAGTSADGLPNWNNRELTDEYAAEGGKQPGADVPFLVLTLLLLTIGVIMVLSASFAREYYTTGMPARLFMRQFVFAVSGVAIMLIVSRIKVRTLSRWAVLLYVVSIALLALVLAVGVKLNGARRWLSIGGANSALTFQPSEIAKLALILIFAQMICSFGRSKMKTFKYGVVPFVVMTGLTVGLVALEPHLSAAIIITTLAVVLMFAGGTRLRWFALAGLVIASVVGFVVFSYMRAPAREGDTQNAKELVSQTQWDAVGLGYAGRRLNAWLDPEADPLGDGFQIRQSLYAVGSGGLLGQGLGQSKQKYLYLPEEHNDYIFAIVCEELGYIGAMLILLLFALLVVRGFWLALHAKDKFSSLVVTGITSLLAIQVFLNVAVVTNLLPATGISLPFFSSGGTALWIQLVQMGIVLSISRDIPREPTV